MESVASEHRRNYGKNGRFNSPPWIAISNPCLGELWEIVGTAQVRLSCIKYCCRQALPVPAIAKVNKVQIERDNLKVSRIADFIKKQWEVKIVHTSHQI
ncbi:hypothetical protein GQ457_18G025270 [Hibiscus cannabinus]